MDKCYVMDMLTVLYYALRQEAEVVAILLGQPYQRGTQCLRGLLHKRLEVDDIVARRSATLGHDRVQLFRVRVRVRVRLGLGLGLGLGT